MNEKEVIEQLESLIEAWQLDEADLNQTDINAIKKMLDKNKQLKEQLEASEKARKEAIELLEKHLETKCYGNHKYELFSREYLEELLKILDLDIDKGE